MPVSLEQFGIDRLSVEDQHELLGLLWDHLNDGQPVQVPDWHLPILKERIAEADANPGAGIPWEVVKAELLGEP